MTDLVNTHNVTIEFGKHKGELWTRIPIGYLKWILNEMSPTSEAYAFAESELNRRGDTMPKEVEISNHAIDRASLRVRKAWHYDRDQDEGIYSWLVRISTEALAEKNQQGEQNERMRYKGCVLVFTYGNFYPTLKTVMNDKKFKIPERDTPLQTTRGPMRPSRACNNTPRSLLDTKQGSSCLAWEPLCESPVLYKEKTLEHCLTCLYLIKWQVSPVFPP